MSRYIDLVFCHNWSRCKQPWWRHLTDFLNRRCRKCFLLRIDWAFPILYMFFPPCFFCMFLTRKWIDKIMHLKSQRPLLIRFGPGSLGNLYIYTRLKYEEELRQELQKAEEEPAVPRTASFSVPHWHEYTVTVHDMISKGAQQPQYFSIQHPWFQLWFPTHQAAWGVYLRHGHGGKVSGIWNIMVLHQQRFETLLVFPSKVDNRVCFLYNWILAYCILRLLYV